MEYYLFKFMCHLFMSKEQFTQLRWWMFKYLTPLIFLWVGFVAYSQGCEHGFTWKPLNNICYKM